MHKDIFVFLPEHTKKARQIVDLFLENSRLNKDRQLEGILCISGISGVGKSEIASECHRLLYDNGISSYIVNMDKFYRVNADVREEWRKTRGYVGHDEMDWVKIENELFKFDNNDIQVLIIEGLYANYIDGGLRFYIEGNIESSDEFRKLRGKEDEDDAFRQFVVGEEYADILRSLQYCDYTI